MISIIAPHFEAEEARTTNPISVEWIARALAASGQKVVVYYFDPLPGGTSSFGIDTAEESQLIDALLSVINNPSRVGGGEQ